MKAEKTASKKKKKFHWWFIPIALVALVLILVLALVGFMRSMLPWPNVVAMTSNFQLNIPQSWRAFNLSASRDYSTLPDPLTNADGSAITTTQDYEARREEVLRLFEEHVYGVLPREGFTTAFETVEEGEALDGKAIRRQVKITVSTEKGSSDALLLLYLPKQDAPAPVVVGLNFIGNHTVLDDPAILPSYSFDTATEGWEEKRGSAAGRWNIVGCIDRGYGVATIFCNDFAPDSAETYNSRVVGLFDEPEFKAVSAWAFGILRGVDYLVGDPAVDSGHIADVGHSRLGKAAVWAGANDTRIGLVISNDSGNTGASLSRSNHGETVYSITKFFPHWFCSRYAEYGKNENALPVDQNLLLAAIAPRQLYVASAEDDLWADPQGAWNSLMAAQSVFALYGMEVLPPSDSQPPVNQPVWSEAVGYHVRSGWHNIQKADWDFYLDYMDAFFTA